MKFLLHVLSIRRLTGRDKRNIIGGIILKWGISLLGVWGSAMAGNIVFMHFDAKAPSLEKPFERSLRENLTVLPNTNLVDYAETMRLKRRIKKYGLLELPHSSIDSIVLFVGDTTLFVWGTVERYTIQPVRRYIIGAAVEGTLTFRLRCYSLLVRKNIFIGNITVTKVKSKGFILFEKKDRRITISALERMELQDQLIREAAQKSTRAISAVLRSVTEQNKEYLAENVEKEKTPSLSDVFMVPSMEAPTIEEEIEGNEIEGNEQEGEKIEITPATDTSPPETQSEIADEDSVKSDEVPLKTEPTAEPADMSSADGENPPPEEESATVINEDDASEKDDN
jgi:hypothetical protein